MEIYEIGQTVLSRITGGSKSNKNTKKTNYVCILDDTQQSLSSAYCKMLQELSKTEDIISSDMDKLLVSTPNKNYTLAHERIFKKGKEICIPSNLLRYIYTRNFNIDTLYIDKNNEIVDITNSLSEINHSELRAIIPFNEAITCNNEILFKALYLRLFMGYSFANNIEFFLVNFPETVKPLSGTSFYFNKILKAEGFNGLHKINKYMHYYSGLERYIKDFSGLDVSATFTPTEQAVVNYKNAIDKMENNKKFDEIRQQNSEINGIGPMIPSRVQRTTPDQLPQSMRAEPIPEQAQSIPNPNNIGGFSWIDPLLDSSIGEHEGMFNDSARRLSELMRNRPQR